MPTYFCTFLYMTLAQSLLEMKFYKEVPKQGRDERRQEDYLHLQEYTADVG